MVIAQGCGQRSNGSGFVAGPGLVETNAHVIAGMDDVSVVDSTGRRRRAHPVLFDPGLDVAILRSPSVAGRPLSLLRDVVERGTAGAVLGFPGGAAFRARPAAVRTELVAVGRDIYGRAGHAERVPAPGGRPAGELGRSIRRPRRRRHGRRVLEIRPVGRRRIRPDLGSSGPTARGSAGPDRPGRFRRLHRIDQGPFLRFAPEAVCTSSLFPSVAYPGHAPFSHPARGHGTLRSRPDILRTSARSWPSDAVSQPQARAQQRTELASTRVISVVNVPPSRHAPRPARRLGGARPPTWRRPHGRSSGSGRGSRFLPAGTVRAGASRTRG